MLHRILALTGAMGLLIACANATPTPHIITATVQSTLPPTIIVVPTDTQAPTLAAPTDTPLPGAPTATNAPTATARPANWQDWPVIPTVSETAKEIYRHGQELGRDPHKFAKAGDCGGTPSWFLGPFDGDPSVYQLGQYGYLRGVIDYFSGSFSRVSIAAQNGFVASALFAPLRSDPSQCKPNEGPLICEIRVTNASFGFIMLGTNDVDHPDQFEPQMRRAIEDLIDRGVVPILATKADNREQDNSINATIVRLAVEYDVPLWNFWRAVQDLPNHGLDDTGDHLTWAGNHFDNPEAMRYGWPVRNLTALQALDAVWRGVTGKK